MSAIRETIDAWEPVFKMGVVDLFDGISHRLEEAVAGMFSLGSYGRRMHKAVRQKHPRAGEKALQGYIVAAVADLGASETGKSIVTLSRQNRRRLEQKGRRYGRLRPRRPSFDEGKEIAEILLSDPYGETQYDPSTGLKPISNIIARAWLSPEGRRDQETLRDIVESSRTSAFFWDVIDAIDKEWHTVGKAPPPVLVKWREEVRAGLRTPPPKKPAPVGRHPRLDDLVRDIKIRYTINLLSDLGFTPTGRNGGWEIVAETVYLSPSTVEKICEPEPWEMVRKYAEFIAKGI